MVDCQRLYGFIFPHDDSVNDRAEGGQLDLAWQTTNVRAYMVMPHCMWHFDLPTSGAVALEHEAANHIPLHAEASERRGLRLSNLLRFALRWCSRAT